MTPAARTIAYGSSRPCAALHALFAPCLRRSRASQYRFRRGLEHAQRSFAGGVSHGNEATNDTGVRFRFVPTGASAALRKGLEPGLAQDGTMLQDEGTAGSGSVSRIPRRGRPRKNVLGRETLSTPGKSYESGIGRVVASKVGDDDAKQADQGNMENQEAGNDGGSLTHGLRSMKLRAPKVYNKLLRSDKNASASKHRECKTEELYRLMKVAALGAHNAFPEDLDTFLQELVVHRGEKPNIQMYAALLLSNTHPHGSAFNIANILDEMVEESIVPDSEVYHLALKALAVHPDALLRGRVLTEMAARWFTLSSAGWNDVVAGCVREDQLELACVNLDEMNHLGVVVQPWLYDMIIYSMCDHEEMDEALRLMKQRTDSAAIGISASLWYYLFDTACEVLHHETIQFVWQQRVLQLYLTPTTGQCLAVLNSCSRQADVSIATDVFRVLSERGFVFTSIHYELLIATYISADDLKTALTITCIMAGAGMDVSPAALAPISLHLKADPSLPQQALEMLDEMVKEDKRSIPMEVIICLIQAASGHLDLPMALKIYEALHRLTPAAPDVHVFNAVLGACSSLASRYYGLNDTASAQEVKDTALFLASEMLHLKIEPNATTYDRLVQVCARQAEYTDMVKYLEETLEVGHWPGASTWIVVMRRLREHIAALEPKGEAPPQPAEAAGNDAFNPDAYARDLLRRMENDKRCTRQQLMRSRATLNLDGKVSVNGSQVALEEA